MQSNLTPGRRTKKGRCKIISRAKPKLPTGIRRLKIQPKYVDRASKNIFVPLIILTGQWLREIGFECEKHVLIEEKDGQLIIRIDKDE